jgi:hypothetical protein
MSTSKLLKPPRNQGTGRYTLNTAGTDPKFTARVVDFGLAHTHASVESREASGPAPSRTLHQKSGSTGAEDQPKQILLVGYTTAWSFVNASHCEFTMATRETAWRVRRCSGPRHDLWARPGIRPPTYHIARPGCFGEFCACNGSNSL